MTSSRYTNIPIEHVKAELATFPFASEAALQLSVVDLCPKLSGKTAPLWRKTEKMLVSSFPGNSVDEAIAIRDHLWFSKSDNKAVPLHHYLYRLAHDFLQPQGFSAIPLLPRCLFPDGMDGRNYKPLARQTWWWLSVSLPPDFLLATLHDNGHQPDRIEVVSPLLNQQLIDHGYAEIHLHMGAAMDFRTLWTSAIVAIANPAFKENAFFSPSALLDEGRQLAPWLIRAVIIRYILAAYLSNRQEKRFINLEHFIASFVRSTLAKSGLGCGGYTLLLYILSDLQQGQLSLINFTNLQQLYREITHISLAPVDSLGQLDEADPVAELFCKEQRTQVPVDIFYIRKALSYLKECEHSSSSDKMFECLFWQTLRIQALFHRHMIQRPLTRGLQWFLRFYGRSSPSRHPLSHKLYLESAAKLCGVSKGLKSLEIRTAPKKNISDLLKLFQNCHTTINSIQRDLISKNKEAIEIGLVLHFTKRRGGKIYSGLPAANKEDTHASPANKRINLQGFRFASFYMEKQREAMSVKWLLQNFPDSLQLLRGLDVCTDELAVPNWVLSPLLIELRELSCTTSNTLRVLTGCEIPPLRMTAHAGEDFIHLLTGLRYIDHTIDAFKLVQGDRLGHCIALGIDPAGWASSIGRVALPQEERLFDLLWVWAKHGATQWWQEGDVSMEYQLTEITYNIFKGVLPLSHSSDEQHLKAIPDKFQLFQLMNDLNNQERLTDIGFPTGATRPKLNDRRNQLLYLYLTSQKLFENGQELLWIDPKSESQLLTNIQNELRRKIGTLGITVEVNPSSNQLIGDFGDLESHPLWRLFPPIPLDNVPPVSICIGSDDPLVFASDLRQEYQRVHDALIIAGLSEQQADNWINKVRENGLNSRFTLPPNHAFINKVDPSFMAYQNPD